MSSPSLLGDIGSQIRCLPASTSTASFVNIAAGTDTGVVVNTGVILDLAQALGYSSTGGKPLDSTVNPEITKGSPRFHSVAIAVPLELVMHSSGKSIHVSVAHGERSATSGAGSTWATRETEVFRFKGGTSTDVTTFGGVVSSIPGPFKRYYKATVTVKRLKATSTAAADTSTDTSVLINSPVYLLRAAADAQLNKV